MHRHDTRQALVEHYLDFYGMAFALLHDADDAKDAVQEAIVRTMTRPVVNKPVNYCMQAVRRVAIDTLRRRKRITTWEDAGLDNAAATTAAPTTPDHDMAEAAARLHQSLPEVLRDLVELHDVHGYTHDQLATITGLSKMTVRRRLKEAHDVMRTQLQQMI